MSAALRVREQLRAFDKGTRVVIAEFDNQTPGRDKALCLMGSTLRNIFISLGVDFTQIKAELIEFTAGPNIEHRDFSVGALDVLPLDPGWLSPDSRVWRLNWQSTDARSSEPTHPSTASVVFAEASSGHEPAGFNIVTAANNPTIEPYELLEGFMRRYRAEEATS